VSAVVANLDPSRSNTRWNGSAIIRRLFRRAAAAAFVGLDMEEYATSN
jgi:hypothetical protein